MAVAAQRRGGGDGGAGAQGMRERTGATCFSLDATAASLMSARMNDHSDYIDEVDLSAFAAPRGASRASSI